MNPPRPRWGEVAGVEFQHTHWWQKTHGVALHNWSGRGGARLKVPPSGVATRSTNGFCRTCPAAETAGYLQSTADPVSWGPARTPHYHQRTANAVGRGLKAHSTVIATRVLRGYLLPGFTAGRAARSGGS